MHKPNENAEMCNNMWNEFGAPECRFYSAHI